MSKPCHRCPKSSSTPSNFLLLCGSCKRGWHHRCHIPPVEDAELIQRIRSQTAGDRSNGLDGWRCKRCKKNQAAAAESSNRTAAQRPDVNQRPLPSAPAQGLALPKDKREINANVATHSAGPAESSIKPTAHVFHTAEVTQLNDHGNQRQQQQGSHTGSQTRNLDSNIPPTTAVKRLQTKRVLQEQHLDGPREVHDYPHKMELCLDQPAAPPKYARASDGKKLASSGHPPRVEQPTAMNCITPSHMQKPEARKEHTPPSRSVTLFCDRATHSPFTSRPVQEDSAVKSPCEGNGRESCTRTDTPSATPVEHGDIHMKNLGDNSDDLYGPPSSSTPVLLVAGGREQQGGSVMQEGRQEIQRQGVSQSRHEPEGQSSLKRTPKVEAVPSLGPDWLKARYSVADDPWRCVCDRQPRTYGDSRRKKPKAKFLDNLVHSVATTDRELLGFLFCRDWIQQTQVNI